MKIGRIGFGLCLLALLGGLGAAPARQARTAASGGIEPKLAAYLANFLAYDPGIKVTLERGSERYAGFQAWKAKRTGKYPKLAADVTVFVSEDGRWFFDGEIMANPNPRPVSSAADLSWLEQRTAALYRTRARAALVPQVDLGFFVAHEYGGRRAELRGQGAEHRALRHAQEPRARSGELDDDGCAMLQIGRASCRERV